MSLSEKLKTSGFWQLIEVFALVVCQFAYFAIMARLLEKEDFGLMAIANSFVAFGAIFAEGGMGAALIQYKKVTHKHINAALQGGIFFGIFFFVLLWVLSPYVALFFDLPELTSLIRVIAVNFILLAISGVSMSLLHKNYQFKQSSMVTIVACVIGYTVGVVLGIYGFGVWSLVVAALLFSFLKALGYYIYAPIKLSAKLHVREWKDLFSFGSGMILLKISSFIGNGGLNLVMGKIFVPSVLGVFDRAFHLKTLPSRYLGNVLDKIMFPVMSEIQDEEDRLFKVYQHGLGLSNAILMPLSLFLIFFSPEIVHLLLGKDWSEAIIPLQIMFAVLPFSISGRMADSVIRAKGLIYKNVIRKYIYVIILLATVSLGGYLYGLVGAAFGVTFSFLVNYVMMIYLVKRIFNKSFQSIFYRPLKDAVFLSFILAVIFVLYKSIFGLWGEVNVWYFLIFSLAVSCGTFFLAIKKPHYLGVYIEATVTSILNKKKSKPSPYLPVK